MTDPIPVEQAAADDTALPVTSAAAASTQVAVSVETAEPARPRGAAPVGLPAETDAAHPVSVRAPQSLEQAVESYLLPDARAVSRRVVEQAGSSEASPESRAGGGPHLEQVVVVEYAFDLQAGVSDAAYHAAITSSDRWPICRIRADWDRDGFNHPLADLSPLVERLTIDRELSGELPPEIGLVEGVATARMSAELGGTWIDRTVEALTPGQDQLDNYCPVPVPGEITTGWEVRVYNDAVVLGAGPLGASVTGMTRPFALRASIDPGSSGGQIGVFSAPTANVVAPGDVWTGRVEWRCDQGFTAQLLLVWSDQYGAFLSNSVASGSTFTGTANTVYTRVLTATAPAGARCVQARVQITPAAGPVTVEATCVRLDRVSDSAMPYLDGDSPDWEWTGIPYASTARRPTTMLTAEESVATALAPHRTGGPFTGVDVLGTPVEVDTGMLTDDGERTTRQFTGTLSRAAVSSAERVAVVDGLDPAALLRATITQPAMGIDYLLYRANGPGLYRDRAMNVQWLVDRICRANGIYASPPARPDTVLSATLHGASAPERGYGGMPVNVLPAARANTELYLTGGHPFGMMYPAPATLETTYSLESPLTAAIGSGIGFSMWMLRSQTLPDGAVAATPASIALSSNTFLDLRLGSAGQIGVRLRFSNTSTELYSTYVPPATPEWQYAAVHVAFGDIVMWVTFKNGTGAQTTTAVQIPRRVTQWAATTNIDFKVFQPMTNFQVWSQYLKPTTNDEWGGVTHISQADIDMSLNWLTAIPELLEENSWPLLKELRAAEFATMGFTETGRFFYRSRAVLRPRGAPEVVSTDRNLAEIAAVTDLNTVRNEIVVSTTATFCRDWETIYEAQTEREFWSPPGRSIFELTLPSSTYEIARGVNYQVYVEEDIEDLVNDPKRKATNLVCAVRGSFPVEIAPNVVVSVQRVDAFTALIIVDNPNSYAVSFNTPADYDANGITSFGNPAFYLRGRRVTAADPVVVSRVDQDSVDNFGRFPYDLPGEQRWRQRLYTMNEIADAVLAQTARPIPVIDQITVPHDPRRSLGDPLRIVDNAGLGSIPATVIGLSTTFEADESTDEAVGSSGGGATDVITARPVAPPNMGLMDDLELGLLNDTMILA